MPKAAVILVSEADFFQKMIWKLSLPFDLNKVLLE